MAGNIKKILDTIILERSKGNEVIANSTRTKLILKGINPEKFTSTSPDDPAIIQKVRAAALELGVRLA